MISDVTLIGVETRAHKLALAALADTASKAAFGEVIICTDQPGLMELSGARHVIIPDYRDKIAFGLFYYTEAAQHARTSHVLLMEWDAGINDPAMWSDEFLEYDYIGAPWPWLETKGLSVGNGGFSLWSKRLADFVYANRERFPIATDVLVAQVHRPAIEAAGFKWGPPDVAARFAYEGWTVNGALRPTSRPSSFGFHAVYNWPYMLTRADLRRRTWLLKTSPLPDKRPKMNMLFGMAPWLKQEALP